MKEFFKLTKAKIILAVLLSTVWIVFSLAQSFFGVSLCDFGGFPASADGPTPTPIPVNIIDTTDNLSQIISVGNSAYCPPQDPDNPDEYAASYNVAEFIFYVISLIPAYLVSCILAFCVTRLKNRKKNYTAPKLKK
jgi:hypothetical protein